MVFDDTYDHEVWNKTAQERVVLLLDFERPMRFWGRMAYRAFIRAFRFTAFYKEPKRKLKSFEERFEAAARRADKMLEGDKPQPEAAQEEVPKASQPSERLKTMQR